VRLVPEGDGEVILDNLHRLDRQWWAALPGKPAAIPDKTAENLVATQCHHATRAITRKTR
jgi:hypothetical protein